MNVNNETIISAHIKEARKLFELDDYFLTTIYSNRIISDALILDSIEAGIVGYMIRVLSLSYTNFKNFNPGKLDSAYLAEVRTPGIEFLAWLDLGFNSSNNSLESAWQEFVKFKNAFRTYQHSQNESKEYYTANSNEHYVNISSKWLVDFLVGSKQYLFLDNNNLFKGILNEVERIANMSGYDIENTLILSSLMCMDWAFDYARVLGFSDQEAFKRLVNEEFVPAIDELAQIRKDQETRLKRITQLVWKFLRQWRSSFLIFMELREESPSKESKVALPLEFKNKLTDILSRSVKKEMGLK